MGSVTGPGKCRGTGPGRDAFLAFAMYRATSHTRMLLVRQEHTLGDRSPRFAAHRRDEPQQCQHVRTHFGSTLIIERVNDRTDPLLGVTERLT
jgi:hypothetical protein